MITCVGHELGHAYDDLRRVYGSLSNQKNILEQTAGKYLKMRNGEVRNIRIKNFDKSTNQVTLDYMLNNSQYNPISDLKNDYNKRALSPENDNISKDELWNITYFFQNLYETSPTEMNANISTTNIELKHNKAQSKNNEKKFSKSEIENRVKETKAYKTYSKVLSNSQNIYPKLSDDAINEIREKCKEKNITPYECNFVDNKQWWNCVCQRMQYYAQYCINKCYKNAMLIYYTEDELTKMKQGGNTQLPISNMSKQQIQDRRQQIKNRRGKIQSPFSNNNI